MTLVNPHSTVKKCKNFEVSMSILINPKLHDFSIVTNIPYVPPTENERDKDKDKEKDISKKTKNIVHQNSIDVAARNTPQIRKLSKSLFRTAFPLFDIQTSFHFKRTLTYNSTPSLCTLYKKVENVNSLQLSERDLFFYDLLVQR